MTPTEALAIVTDLVTDNVALFSVIFPAVAGVGIAFAMIKRGYSRIKRMG